MKISQSQTVITKNISICDEHAKALRVQTPVLIHKEKKFANIKPVFPGCNLIQLHAVKSKMQINAHWKEFNPRQARAKPNIQPLLTSKSDRKQEKAHQKCMYLKIKICDDFAIMF